MGASAFTTIGKGKTVQEAFAAARKDAQYEYGHGGYSGTIAEKNGYATVGAGAMLFEDAQELADKLIDEDDPRISDKWGPAGVIPLATGDEWLFFGWASS